MRLGATLRTGEFILAALIAPAVIAPAAPAVAVASVAESSRPPTLSVISASVTVSEPRGGNAGKAFIRVRYCAQIGPRSALLFRETRKLGGLTKASSRSSEPLGVDLQELRPYTCHRFWVAWVVRAKLLVGGGTYSVTVRLLDAHDRLTRPVGFSLRIG